MASALFSILRPRCSLAWVTPMASLFVCRGGPPCPSRIPAGERGAGTGACPYENGHFPKGYCDYETIWLITFRTCQVFRYAFLFSRRTTAA
jgi:hypothetical protein